MKFGICYLNYIHRSFALPPDIYRQKSTVSAIDVLLRDFISRPVFWYRGLRPVEKSSPTQAEGTTTTVLVHVLVWKFTHWQTSCL